MDPKINDITLAIIAKNEEEGLEKAILSCKNFVDKIIISVDTKSTDKTLEIAKKYANYVYRHVWESSFAKARNDLQKHVTTKWVLWLDGHEYVEKCENLKQALESEEEGLIVKLRMEDNFSFHFARIVRSHVNWIRAVHNLPKCKTSKVYRDFLIIHDRKHLQEKEAAIERFGQRNEMNFKILHEEVKKDKKNIRALFYLGQQYRLNGEMKKAIHYYQQYLKYSKNKQERWVVYWEAATSAAYIEKYNLSIKFLEKAEKELPNRWEVAKRIGGTYMLLGKWKDALPYLVNSFTTTTGRFLFEPEQRNDAETWFLISQCFFNLREYEKGKVALRRALEIHERSATEKLTAEYFRTAKIILGEKEVPIREDMMIEVCFLVYKRYQRLPEILEQLKNQTIRNFKVNIWNNSGEKLDTGDFPQDRLKIFHVGDNVGSQARFKLAKKTTGNPIIFIDDDEYLYPNFIEYHYKQYLKFGPKCILGYFTRTFNQENYWQCLDATYGEEVDYIATKSMILDRKIIDEEPLLQNIPEPFTKTEDLYLCYLARTKYGMKMIKINPASYGIVDNQDQYSKLLEYKEEAFSQLRKQGWRLLRDK